MGCFNLNSAKATYSKTFSLVYISETISDTTNSPVVSVPVLSKTTVLTLEITSKKMLPLTKIPFLADFEIAKKKLTGTEITKAQGQEITKKHKAL